jgi:hypothetical protein
MVAGEGREAAEVLAVTDALLDGLTDGGGDSRSASGPARAASSTQRAAGSTQGAGGGALRTLCAGGVREMLLWSARHLTDPAATNVNARALLRRLLERLAHPNAEQRWAD